MSDGRVVTRAEPNGRPIWIGSDLAFNLWCCVNERHNGQELDRRINVNIRAGYTRVDCVQALYIYTRAHAWIEQSIDHTRCFVSSDRIACELALRRPVTICLLVVRDMISWKRKSSSAGCKEMRERLIEKQATSGPSSSCVPRGCVAVLVGDEEPGERVVVEVRALGQPCVRALLEVAEREFGYDQKGVLRIPCPADEFRRAVAADSTAAAAGGGGHHHHRR
jgi:SAUR family protein